MVKPSFHATFCTTNVLHKSRIRNAKIIFFFWNEKKREHAFVFYHQKHTCSIKTPQGPCTYTRQTQLNEYCIYLHSCNVLKIIFSLYWSFCSNVVNIFYIWPHYRRKKRMFQKQLKFWYTDVLIVGRKRPVGLNIDLHVIQRCGGTNYKIVMCTLFNWF